MDIFSDCDTNFMGADRELRKMFTAHSKESRIISKELAKSRVQWRFNPPSAPHFGALPEPTLQDVPSNRLSRWKHIQQMRDHFWNRWAQEYVQSLIRRPKWQHQTTALQPGRLCLLLQESTSPSR
ncbi:hypothetical protein RF55_18474 [Lasius niger]|uniref:DUF5641 domain-containing protein n=1 Tax=Lasius niger TaxID=67767 RepID=A0A0J7K0Y6_LASNI|nr:hypothetical protein RF55_18474 [Lasius niger]